MNLFKFYAAFGLLLVLVSCQHDSKKAVGNTGLKVTGQVKDLNFIGQWKNEGLREDLVKELVHEFEFLNQEYRVNLKFPEEVYWDRSDPNCEAAFIQKCITAETSDWDLVRINNQQMVIGDYLKDPNWAANYFVDFSQMPEFSKNVAPQLFDSVKRSWGGVIPGSIIEGYNWAVWFNKELAQKLGLDIKLFGMTADDLKGYILKVVAYNQTAKEPICPIFECADWSTFPALALQLYMSEVNNPALVFADNTSDLKLNSWFKTLQFFETLAQLKIFDYDWKSLKWEKSWHYPLQQRCLFYVNATWMYNIWQKMDKEKVKQMIPAELPVFNSTSCYFGGYNVMWAVPKNAPNKEAAIKFVLFLNSAYVAEKWANYTKCSTGIKGRIITNKLGFDQFENFNFEIDKKYGINKVMFDNNSLFILGKSHKQDNNYLHEVAYGSISAKDAIVRIKRALHK